MPFKIFQWIMVPFYAYFTIKAHKHYSVDMLVAIYFVPTLYSALSNKSWLSEENDAKLINGVSHSNALHLTCCVSLHAQTFYFQPSMCFFLGEEKKGGGDRVPVHCPLLTLMFVCLVCFFFSLSRSFKDDLPFTSRMWRHLHLP